MQHFTKSFKLWIVSIFFFFLNQNWDKDDDDESADGDNDQDKPEDGISDMKEGGLRMTSSAAMEQISKRKQTATRKKK